MRSAVISRATLVLPQGIRHGPLYLSAGQVAASAPGGAAFELDLRDHLVFPGLINAHDHLQLNSIPPLPQRPPFPNSYQWIEAVSRHRSEPAVQAATAVASADRHRHGALKNLLSGATTVLHHDPWHPLLDEPTFPVRVLNNFRWSHSLGLGLPAQAGAAPAYGPSLRESFAATPPGVPWIIHLAEGTDARAAQELAQLEAFGCLADNTVLVHGVGLSESDTQLLLRRGAALVWFPSSNLSILGETLDPRPMFAAARLALGTDSRLSGARDLLAELKIAAARSDLTARELLQLVTSHAARVLRAPLTGGLETGQHADLIVLRDQGGDPYAQLLRASRADLRAVVRAGAPAVADADFGQWFQACGCEALCARLDGVDKLIARECLGGEPCELLRMEPGLDAVLP